MLALKFRGSCSTNDIVLFWIDLLDHIGVSNGDLGRRGIDEEDANIQKRYNRFSFRKAVIPTSKVVVSASSTQAPTDVVTQDSIQTSRQETTLLGEKESRDDAIISFAPLSKEQKELAAAFRLMAATRSPDKEGDNFGAAFTREDSHVMAISAAKAIEKRVVELIRTIGEVVVQSGSTSTPSISPRQRKIDTASQPTVRSDPVFEYFCEKSILSLLVDIAKEKRQNSVEGRRWGCDSCYHGVVWSPEVKAQVFATVAFLISDCHNRSVLYYLLSHNHVNELIKCMLPLHQWTDQAQSKMMPAYVDMMQKIAVQLSDDPDLFSFLTMETNFQVEREGDESLSEMTSQTIFPLYSAILETATSAFAQSDSIMYGTCLVVAVNIMQISHAPIQDWVCNAGKEQRRLADHMCQRLLDRYYRIVNLTTGPVVDGVRSNAIAGQLAGLKDHMAMIHEVFWSGVRGLDVRLCESLLQQVVAVLLKNLAANRRRSFLSGIGLVDSDVIPEQEALAQVSSVFLSLLFSTLSYVPFQRMMAVALFHEKSTPLWSSSSKLWRNMDSQESYIFMPLLSDIVTGDHQRETCPNTFRREIIKGVSGQYGDWRTTACACLLQAALESEAMDEESSRLLKIIPVPEAEDPTYYPTALEEAIATFLMRGHEPSAVTMESLEYVGFLAIQVLHKSLLQFTQNSVDPEARIEYVLTHSPVWKSLLHAKSHFAFEARKCQTITGVSDIFLDLVESSIQTRYTARFNEVGVASYRCPLSQRGCAATCVKSEMLVRKIRGVSPNDVETSRFFINMTLHYRALCKVIHRLCFSIRKTRSAAVTLDLVDKADDLIRTIGGLSEKPKIGANIDLTGRMMFRFRSALKPLETTKKSETSSRIRALSEDMGVLRSSASLMLVLDPTDMFIAKPLKGTEAGGNRATILCSISLRSVIAAADDGEWLHVAVRQQDVGFLIKNGNMALQLESTGSCLIVKQYLDRSRDGLRHELLDKVSILLNEACTSNSIESAPSTEEKKTSE